MFPHFVFYIDRESVIRARTKQSSRTCPLSRAFSAKAFEAKNHSVRVPQQVQATTATSLHPPVTTSLPPVGQILQRHKKDTIESLPDSGVVGGGGQRYDLK